MQRPLLIIIATAVLAGGAVVVYTILEQVGAPGDTTAPVRIAAIAPESDADVQVVPPAEAESEPAPPVRKLPETTDEPAGRNVDMASTNADSEGETDSADSETAAKPEGTVELEPEFQELEVVAEPDVAAAAAPPPVEVRPRAIETASDLTAPSFDIVHISADGHSVFAGRAEPGASISVMDGDDVVGSGLADSRGEWVVIPDTPLPSGSRELGLTARGEADTNVLSESVVVLHVPGTAKVAPSDIDHDAIAVSLPRGDTGIARLMQNGELGYGIEGARGLSLDSVTYGEVGSFAISGRALPKNEIAAYLDEHDIGRTHATSAGDWTIVPEETVKHGLYTLRVDQLNDGGVIVSRIQTPFTMADVTEIDIAEGLVVVQPGNSLWRIARRIYGRGVQHTIIYQANRDQINEPSLIYPGQIFLVPTPPDDE
ncbi:MAG: LysM peptidoglycan-binding domain-containing protein [Alphaproteobacteria bacterium]|nr:LysM peptidoglycan-binding domain-containing protein [Alphaproteobacteria bacterium]